MNSYEYRQGLIKSLEIIIENKSSWSMAQFDVIEKIHEEITQSYTRDRP